MDFGRYNNTVIEHFMTPRNVGSMKEADIAGQGEFGTKECGDFLSIQISVKDNVIKDIKFLVYGCSAAVASSSMTTVLAKGKTLEEALEITDQQIAEALGGLPEDKLHCSMLGEGALKAAIQDYYNRQRDK